MPASTGMVYSDLWRWKRNKNGRTRAVLATTRLPDQRLVVTRSCDNWCQELQDFYTSSRYV